MKTSGPRFKCRFPRVRPTWCSPARFECRDRSTTMRPNRPPLAVDRQTLRQLQSGANLIAKKNYPDALVRFSGFWTTRKIPGLRCRGARSAVSECEAAGGRPHWLPAPSRTRVLRNRIRTSCPPPASRRVCAAIRRHLRRWSGGSFTRRPATKRPIFWGTGSWMIPSCCPPPWSLSVCDPPPHAGGSSQCYRSRQLTVSCAR